MKPFTRIKGLITVPKVKSEVTNEFPGRFCSGICKFLLFYWPIARKLFIKKGQSIPYRGRLCTIVLKSLLIFFNEMTSGFLLLINPPPDAS